MTCYISRRKGSNFIRICIVAGYQYIKKQTLNIRFSMLLIYTKSQMMIVWQNSGFKKWLPQIINSNSTSWWDTVWHVQWCKNKPSRNFVCDLKELTIPCWCSDTISRFVRPVPQLSMICNVTIHWLDSRWGFKLTALNQQCLTSKNHFFLTTVTHIIWKIIRKITSYCRKISDKKD